MSPCYRQAGTSIGAATPIRRVRARPIWRALAASQGTASSGVRRSPALAKGRNAGIGGRRRVPQPERTPPHLTPSRPPPRPAHHGIEPARGGTAPGSRPDGRFRPMAGFARCPVLTVPNRSGAFLASTPISSNFLCNLGHGDVSKPGHRNQRFALGGSLWIIRLARQITPR